MPKYVNNAYMESKATKLSKISNAIFLIISIFFLFFVWCNYYLKSFRNSLICSLIVVLAFSATFFPLQKIKNKSHRAKSDLSKQKEHFKVQLLYGKYSLVLTYISQLLDIKNYKKISETHLVDLDKNQDIFVELGYSALAEETVNNCIKSSINSNLNIVCINAIKNLINLKNINLQITTLDTLFDNALAKNNILNLGIYIEKSPKLRAKDILCIVLCKEKAKSYFWLGLLLLFYSMFTIYSIYYILSCTALLLLSIYCRFNTRFSRPKHLLDRQ